MSKEKNTSFECALCGNNVECVFDEEGIKSYLCYHCGMRYDLEPVFEDDEKKEFPFYNKEIEDGVTNENHGCSLKCPICGYYTILTGNFMRSEVCGDVDEDKVDEYGCYLDDTIVDNIYCPHCGTNITVIPCKPSEHKDFPYYKDEKETEEEQ